MTKPVIFPTYLPNLLPYRSVIITYVIMVHVLMQLMYMDPRFQALGFLIENSDLSIMLLYILSGFVITFILLKEKNKRGDINVPAFYNRRFRRLYPLYFICITLSYAIYFLPGVIPTGLGSVGLKDYLNPQQEYGILVLLGAHVLFSLKENALSLHTWTVAAEANFYVIWGPLMKRLKNYAWLFVLLFISPVLEFILNIVHYFTGSGWSMFLLNFNSYFRISTLALGALGCYVYLYYPEYIRFCRNRLIQYTVLLLLAFILFSGLRFGIIIHELTGLLFLVIVLGNLDPADNPLPLEYRPLRFIGTISYGMYIFHTACILLCAVLLKRFIFFQSHPVSLLLTLGVSSFCLTVLVSTAVYYSFERRLYEKSSTLLKPDH